jgi:hypothetical protein
MNIYNINNEPFHTLPYRTAASGGGIQYSTFPLFHAEVDRLPHDCAALFVCSDLQGLADRHQADGTTTSMLLGEVLAGELVLCGHMHWKQIIATLPGGPQVANLEARGLLLRQKS